MSGHERLLQTLLYQWGEPVGEQQETSASPACLSKHHVASRWPPTCVTNGRRKPTAVAGFQPVEGSGYGFKWIIYIFKGGCLYYITSIIVHISFSILWFMVPVSDLQRPNNQFFSSGLVWHHFLQSPVITRPRPQVTPVCHSLCCSPFSFHTKSSSKRPGVPTAFYCEQWSPDGELQFGFSGFSWLFVLVFMLTLACNANCLGRYRLFWGWNLTRLQSGLQHKESRWWEL